MPGAFMNSRDLAKWLFNWGLALTSPVALARFALEWRHFVRKGGKARLLDSYPRLRDRTAHTSFDPHYFYQAAWLARRLVANLPEKHVDFASDIRMINVLSAFVAVEFLDYRPLQANLAGLVCGQGDLLAMDRPEQTISSLSSLHVIEHVGLGRYGDRIAPDGSHRAAAELQRLLAPGGRLYISVPVGRERVCFNAHRVFDPSGVLALFPELNLEFFSFVDDAGVFHDDTSPPAADDNDYACGMYAFSRPV